MEDRLSTGFWQKLFSCAKLQLRSKNNKIIGPCYLANLPEEIQCLILEFIGYECYECDEAFIERTKKNKQGKIDVPIENAKSRISSEVSLSSPLTDCIINAYNKKTRNNKILYSSFHDPGLAHPLFSYSPHSSKMVVFDGETSQYQSNALCIHDMKKGDVIHKKYSGQDDCISVAVSDNRRCPMDADIARVMRKDNRHYLSLTHSDRDDREEIPLDVLGFNTLFCAFNKQGNKIIIRSDKGDHRIIPLCTNHTEPKYKKTLLDYCKERGICKKWPTE